MDALQLVGKIVIQGADKAKQDLDDVKSKADQTQSGLSSLLGKIGDFATGALAFAGVQTGLSGIASGISNIIGLDEGVENASTAFTKLLGSSAAAKNEISELQKFAADTPLEFPDVEMATQKLLGYQFQLSQTEPIITAVGDALSSTGNLSSATLEQVINVFGQMHASISLHTQDLMQLSSVGINAFQLLADSIKPTQQQVDALVKAGLEPAGNAMNLLSGKTKLSTADIQELVTRGLIPSQQGIDALTTGIENNPLYKGGMAAQSQTTAGRLSTLHDNINLVLEKISSPIFDQFSKIVGKIGDAVSSPAFQQFATTVGQDIAGAITTTTKDVEAAVNWFEKWHTPILAVAGAIALFLLPATIAEGVALGTTVVEAIVGAVAAIPGLIAAFIGWAVAGWSAAAATIAATWPVLLVVAAIAALIAIIWILVANWQTIWGAITAFTTQAGAAITDGWNHVVDFFSKTVPDAITSGFKWAINGAIDLINDFIGFIDSIHVNVPGIGNVGFNIGKIPHLASGGTITEGGWTVVGENGPEPVWLPQGAVVQPNRGGQGSAPGGNTYVFNNYNAAIDNDRLAVQMRMHEMLAGVA